MASIQSQDLSDSLCIAPYEEMPEKGNHDSDTQLSSVDEWPASVLPRCSKGKDHAKPWTISTSMMQTYFILRGSGTEKRDHPLLSWMAKQDERAGEKEGGSGMLVDIERSIKEQYDWKVQGPAKRDEDDHQAVYYYKRPTIQHLTLDKAIDTDLLELIYENYDKEDDGWREVSSDVSEDDEGFPEDGRISPCTFARWAEGAKRWDTPGDKHRTVWEHRKEYEIPKDRQRPPPRDTCEFRKPKNRVLTFQIDQNDGDPMTPICSEYAKTEPSALWSPRPLDTKLPYDFYKHKIDRMDPELGKYLREREMGTEMSFGLSSAGDIENAPYFGETEVAEVVEKYWGFDHVTDVTADKQRDLVSLKRNEAQINASNERFRHDNARLNHENRKLRDCLALRQSIRERRVLQHVHRHVRALDYESKAKMAEVKSRYRENNELRMEWSVKKNEQAELLKELGKETPEEVFAMFPNVWQPLEFRKNPRNSSV